MKTKSFGRLWQRLGSFGPYIVLEVLLPGGTLLAVLLWISQTFHRRGLVRNLRSSTRSVLQAVIEPPQPLVCPTWLREGSACTAAIA
jgi:hypothetical protein